jgi:hypothetical protein
MYGRLIATGPAELLAARYGIQIPSDWLPSSNLRQGQQGLIIRHDQWGRRQAAVLGMLGVEDILSADGPSRLGQGKRCIIPVNGYCICIDCSCHYITMKDYSVMNCAGILKPGQNLGGKVHDCFSLLATSANVLLTALHPIMPLLLHYSEIDHWLRGECPFMQELDRISLPYPSGLMQVSPYMKHQTIDGTAQEGETVKTQTGWREVRYPVEVRI